MCFDSANRLGRALGIARRLRTAGNGLKTRTYATARSHDDEEHSLAASARSYKSTHAPLLRPRRSARVSARSEEHTSELQSLMRISYAVFCLKKKTKKKNNQQ